MGSKKIPGTFGVNKYEDMICRVNELQNYFRPTQDAPSICNEKSTTSLSSLGDICSIYSNKLYFSIYYKVDDNTFKKSSDTWRSTLTLVSNSIFIEKEVLTEGDFKTDWNNIYQ